MSFNRRHFLSSLAASSLAGCGVTDWFGATPPPPLPGTRLSVLVRHGDAWYLSAHANFGATN